MEQQDGFIGLRKPIVHDESNENNGVWMTCLVRVCYHQKPMIGKISAYLVILMLGTFVITSVKASEESGDLSSTISNNNDDNDNDATLDDLLSSASASQIILKHIEFSKQLLEHYPKIDAFSSGDTLLLERYESIQTRMDRMKKKLKRFKNIKKNPKSEEFTNFINTALTELIAIRDVELRSINDENYERTLDGGKALRAHQWRLGSNVDFILKSYLVDTVDNEGIYLRPTVQLENRQVVERLMTKHSLQDVISALEMVVPHLTKKEQARERLDEIKKQIGEARFDQILHDDSITDEDEPILVELDTLMEAYVDSSDQITKEVETNGTLYQLLIPFQGTYLNNTRDMSERLSDEDSDSSERDRKSIFTFKNSIPNDVLKLISQLEKIKEQQGKRQLNDEL